MLSEVNNLKFASTANGISTPLIRSPVRTWPHLTGEQSTTVVVAGPRTNGGQMRWNRRIVNEIACPRHILSSETYDWTVRFASRTRMPRALQAASLCAPEEAGGDTCSKVWHPRTMGTWYTIWLYDLEVFIFFKPKRSGGRCGYIKHVVCVYWRQCGKLTFLIKKHRYRKKRPPNMQTGIEASKCSWYHRRNFGRRKESTWSDITKSENARGPR